MALTSKILSTDELLALARQLPRLEQLRLARLLLRGTEGEARSGRACAKSVDAQLASLKALTPGWFDETGPAYEPAGLDWLGTLLNGLLDSFQLPTPYLYPTPEGRVQAEWSAPHWEVIVNIDLAARCADVLAPKIDGDDLHELPVTFGEPGAESALGRFLVDHVLAQ
jgi:hypothetical protein